MKTIFYKIPSKISLLLLITLLPFFTMATDYYVSSSVSGGSHNGLSPTNAWSALSDVQSHISSFHAGDNIYFKRGDVFTGFLKLTAPSVGWGGHANSGSSVSPITISAYGTGALPVFQFDPTDTTAYDARDILFFAGLKYWVIENINFSDRNFPTVQKYSPSNNTSAIHMGYPGNDDTLTRCNHFLIQNCKMSLCGLGVIITGDSNTVTHCSMDSFNNVVSTQGTYTHPTHPLHIDIEDYGANGVTICGNHNEVSYNDIRDAWAESYDFAWNGGALEMVDVCTYNKIIYNKFFDCGGIAEFGGLDSGLTTGNNTFAYNKIVNCGGLTYANIDQSFAISVTNNMWYNNVVVENDSSRFSGPNVGNGVHNSVALSHLVPDRTLFQYGSTPISGGAINTVRNNIFHLTNGINVFKHNDAHLDHSNNIFSLSTGIVDVTSGTGEITVAGSTAIFTDTSAVKPIDWNFYPLSGSPQIAAGAPLGISLDFDGHTVSSTTPTDGPLEYLGLTTITTSAISPLTYCAGTTVSVPFTTNGAAISGNIFTAQLSIDNFATHVDIGAITSTAAGTITATIPSSTAGGTVYRIRVVSSSPVVTGSDNGSNITINALPTVHSIATNGEPTEFCSGSSVTLQNNSSGGTWSVVGGTSSSIIATISGDYYVTKTNGCGSDTSNHIIVTAHATPSASAGTYGPLLTTDAPITLTGSPAGGTFSGPGVSGNTFNPLTAGTGVSTIYYSYINEFGCQGIGSTNITVNCGFSAGTLTGPANVCTYIPSTNAVYSIASIGASSYTWTVPSGATLVSGQSTNSITVSYPTTSISGYVGVTVGNACGGASQLVKMYISTSVPGIPGAITGPTNACLFIGTTTHAFYSIAAVANATTYNWSVPAGTHIVSGGGTTSIEVSFDGDPGSVTAGSTIGVQAASPCGNSTSTRTITLVRTNVSLPSPISGPTDVCAYINLSQAVYSTNAQGNASSYSWTITPSSGSGLTIASGQGTNSVHVSFATGFSAATLTVSASNSCSTSGTRTISINKNPDAPSSISGVTNPCPGATTKNYYVTNIPGYSYTWTLPTNASFSSTQPTTDGQHGYSINVDFNSSWSSGLLKVSATSTCGTGSLRLLSLTACSGGRITVNPPVKELNDIAGSVYPNPSDGNFTITLAKAYSIATVKVDIMNDRGQVVYSGSEKCNNGMIALDLHNKLASGVYTVTCTMNGEREVKKLIIAK